MNASTKNTIIRFLVLAFACSLFTDRSIFALGTWSLTGFAGLLPVFVAALYWRRSTSAGAAAATITTIGLWIYFYVDSLSAVGPYTIAETGLMPVAVIVPISTIALIAVSLATKPPTDVERFFP